MTVYPAIDLKGGACVRLRRGDMDSATVYATDPALQAGAWQDAGASWLHVVDLDGAVAGRPVNRAAVLAILAAARVPVQLGGGIRDMAAMEAWLQAGVTRIILGSAAVKNPDLVRQAARTYPGRIVVGIDARDGMVATEGWLQAGTMTAPEVAKRFEQDGVTAIIYTDISRDGMLGGVDVAGTLDLARSVRIPVIASGGIGEPGHLRALVQAANGMLEGVILGRALYDGRVDLAEALRIAADPRPVPAPESL
jgi:phosphoribosylformimino-5-aminoimidazole carboxamide ribotide isomerase